MAGTIVVDAVKRSTGENVLGPVLGTPVTLSGAAVSLAAVPSWANKVTVMVSDVSTNGVSGVRLRLGTAGGVDTTNYVSQSQSMFNGTGYAATGATDGFFIPASAAAAAATGTYILTRLSGNTWTLFGGAAFTNTANPLVSMGGKTLSSALTTLQIATANGTDVFDGGVANVMFE